MTQMTQFPDLFKENFWRGGKENSYKNNAEIASSGQLRHTSPVDTDFPMTQSQSIVSSIASQRLSKENFSVDVNFLRRIGWLKKPSAEEAHSIATIIEAQAIQLVDDFMRRAGA